MTTESINTLMIQKLNRRFGEVYKLQLSLTIILHWVEDGKTSAG